MAVYNIDRTSPLGNQLLNLLERISADFAQLRQLRLVMIEQREGQDGSQVSHYVDVAAAFKYLNGVGGTADNGTVAKASFEEIDAFVGNGGPSLEQCAARHRQ